MSDGSAGRPSRSGRPASSPAARSGPYSPDSCSSTFWWGSVFLISVPAMALLLPAGPALLPEFRSDQAGG